MARFPRNNMVEAYTASDVLTLRQPAELGGSIALPRVSTNVQDTLEANLLVLAAEGKGISFLSLDTLFAGQQMTDVAARAVRKAFGPDVNLIVAASHTHNAPMLDRDKPRLGATSDAFENDVIRVIEALVRRAANSARPVAHATTLIASGSHGVNRRLYSAMRLARAGFRKRTQMFMAPNPAGPVDNSIRGLLLHRPNGDVAAAIVQVACHPTGYPDRFAVSADYVSKLRDVVRQRHGPDVSVIFLQGFSGDVRPAHAGTLSAGSVVRRLVSGPRFQAMSKPQWDTWSDELSAHFRVVLEGKGDIKPLTGKVSSSRISHPVSELLSGYRGSCEFEAIHFEIGGAVTGVAVNAEMLAGWLTHTSGQFFTAGCINDTFGYLPDAASLPRGGYEVDGYMTHFGIDASGWADDYEKRVIAALQRPFHAEREAGVAW